MTARSHLFVPGDRPDRFEKARQAGADAVILDLEDAVTGENKDEARSSVSSAWLSPECPAYVRVNAMSTEWFREDLAAIDLPGLAGIVLPKPESSEQIAQALRGISVGVLALVETALGVWEARALAETPCVECLAFGSVDLESSKIRFTVNLGAEDRQASGILPREIPHAAPRTRWRSRSKFARPYICFLISFKRLICPSTCPWLHSYLSAAATAS